MKKWTKIEKKLSVYTTQELIQLLKELYAKSEDSQLFIDSKILRNKVSLNAYKNKIQKALSADPIYDEGIEWESANKAIQDYRLASGDDEGLAELLTVYVEVGNQFTLDYGDIDEGYYDTMESAFQDAVDHLLTMRNRGKDIGKYRERLRKVVISTANIGWGYGDGLNGVFYDAFGDV